MNGLPYYPRYPRDLIEGTVGMTFEEKTTYGFILDLIYLQGGKLPDDPRYIAGILSVSVRKWNSLRSSLIEGGKIQASGGFLTNYRAFMELEKLSKYQDKQSKNRSNPNKNNDLASPAKHHTEPEPYNKDTKASLFGDLADQPPPKKPKKRACQIPENWVPNEKNIAHALSKNFTEQEIKDEADRFRDHKLQNATTHVDWDAAWRTWISNARRFSGGRGVAGTAYGGGRGQSGSIASVVARRHAGGQN